MLCRNSLIIKIRTLKVDIFRKFILNVFGKGGKKVRTKVINFSGHVEGDFRLITSFIKLINGTLENKEDVTFIDATIPSHKIIMAAAESRHNSGVPVEMDTLVYNDIYTL